MRINERLSLGSEHTIDWQGYVSTSGDPGSRIWGLPSRGSSRSTRLEAAYTFQCLPKAGNPLFMEALQSNVRPQQLSARAIEHLGSSQARRGAPPKVTADTFQCHKWFAYAGNSLLKGIH